MAQIVRDSVRLNQPTVVGGLPTIGAPAGGQISFGSPDIRAHGEIEISGTPGENVGNWRLGFFQLQFVETNYARYRGRMLAHGSARISWSHLRLCRDTDEHSPDIWYDPASQGVVGGRGTFTVPAGTTLPANGRLRLASGFSDAPGQDFVTKVVNRGHDNFLHHVDIAFHFCTMLVAEDPTHHFLVLKHFYWNVRWEAHFQPDATGNPTVTTRQHLDLNVQRHVHSDVPNDTRFAGHVFDRHLPISNVMASRHPRQDLAQDWSLS